MQQILRLFSLDYLFHRNLGPFTSNLAWIFLGVLAAAMLAALFLRVKTFKNRDIFGKKIIKKLFLLAWVMGLTGIFLWLFRQISVQYLSAPVLLLVWAVIAAVWLGFFLKYWLKTVPGRRKQLALETKRKQYLP